MANQIRRHNVILKATDGRIEVHPLKQWLREHPAFVPAGMDPDTSTSHELRRALQSQGWVLEIRPSEVRVIKPTEDGDSSFADILPDNDLEAEREEGEDEITSVEEITFGLERDLQSALRAHINQLESGLQIIDGGKERVTDAGKIDITALDTKGNIVVIELKAGIASPQVVAQVLAYMGAIGENEHKPVRGILVAGDFHKRVILAARAIPNLHLKKYSFQFGFADVR